MTTKHPSAVGSAFLSQAGDVITITGPGDHDQPEWLITINGIRNLLLAANKAVHIARQSGAAALPEPDLRRILAQYDGTLAQGLTFHEQQPPLGRKPGARGRVPRRPGHNLLMRLRERKTDVLRFAVDFAVPFTNNQAEQDLRMMKVKMKISGGFRTDDRANIFVALRSVISTARKHGLNFLKAFTATPADLVAELSG